MRQAVDIFRKLSLAFYPGTQLDKLTAPPILTPEEVILKSAIEEIQQELIEVIARKARKAGFLTDYQKIVLDGIMDGKKTKEITEDLGYESVYIGGYAVYVCLHGYANRIKSGKRCSGLYVKFKKGLKKNRRVKHFLYLLEVIKEGNLEVALNYLKTTKNADFWRDYEKEVKE